MKLSYEAMKVLVAILVLGIFFGAMLLVWYEESKPKFTIIAELPQERLQEKLDNMTFTKVIIHYRVSIINLDEVRQGKPLKSYVLVNRTMECDKIPRNVTIVIPVTSEIYKHIGNETFFEVVVVVVVEKDDTGKYIKLGHLVYSVTYTKYRMERFFDNGILHIPSKNFWWRVTDVDEIFGCPCSGGPV